MTELIRCSVTARLEIVCHLFDPLSICVRVSCLNTTKQASYQQKKCLLFLSRLERNVNCEAKHRRQ